jgi:acyl carrier protein
VWVAGPHVAKGYWTRPDESRATFQAYLADTGDGPFLRTGDLGCFRNGNLLVTGRLKDLIIVNGRNLYPQDIEWTVERVDSALSPTCGAAFSADVDGQEQLVIVQELAPRERVDLLELLTTVRQAVAEEHEIHVHDVVLIKPGTIPRTSSGKIRRRATHNQYLAGDLQVLSAWRLRPEAAEEASNHVVSREEGNARATSRSPDAPSKAMIRDWLIAQLSSEIRVSPAEIDIHRPFTYYGLASIEGVALAGKLEEWLTRPVSLSLVWDYPTIDAASSYLIQSQDRS